MRALAGLIIAGPMQAVLVVALCTVLSFLAPPLTSILSYVGAAALALYCLHHDVRAGLIVLGGAVLLTGVLAEVLAGQGAVVAVTSMFLWWPVWLAAVVLRNTRSMAMAMLALTVLAMIAVLVVYLLYGEPTAWWQQQLQAVVEAIMAQPDLQLGDASAAFDTFVEQVAPVMTGLLAAGLSLAALGCLVLGRWWQSLLIKPGALRKEF